jgi:glutathione peroxidase
MKLIITILATMVVAQMTQAAEGKSLQDIPLNDINGKATSLKAYSGKVVLLVNVASKCGYTPQYAGLEALYKKYQDKGLVIVGVPSNDFGHQEPGTAEEIQTFCKKNYGVTFPLMEKVHVKGPEKVPLYVALTGPESAFPGEIKWNFNKFLIGRDGKLVKRFDSKVTPESAEMTEAVESALGHS